MSQNSRHQGVIVPMATPFTPSGDLDDKAAERIIDRLAKNKLGVFVLGTTGEAASIRPQKRSRLVQIALSVAAKRVPVYAGIGDNSSENSISAAKEYLKEGVDAVVAHLPSYYILRPIEMQSYFELLVREIQGSLVLYNIPQTTHMSLPLDVVEALSQHPQIVGFKDSENVAGRIEETAKRFVGRKDFSIFMGASVLSSKALRLGFNGLVPGPGNIAPETLRDLYAAALAGEWEKVDVLQAKTNAAALLFQRNRLLGEGLSALKAAMAAQGLCSPTMLPPLLTMSEEGQLAIKKELETLNLR